MEMQGYKCKTCGGLLDEARSSARDGLVVCPYCGNTWTLPKKGTSPAALEFLRIGEHELDICKFGDALSAYKKAAELDQEEPEAYFGMALSECKVQYLKDEAADPPRLQPICHEISEKRFTENKNFERALSLASGAQKAAYQKKGEEIDRIRSEFLQLKREGLDFDCFLCAKVTSEDGGNTQDSHEALRIYNYLKERGYAPFYSEAVAGDRTGSDYEALILYALYTSECMLIVCSNEEYLETKWVKNEYTRFSAMVANEEKERDAIAFVYRGKPIEKLPGRSGKLEGIDLSKPDAYSRIGEYIASFRPITFASPEIRRKEYKGTPYIKRNTVRRGVEKRTLMTVAAGEIAVSNPTQRNVAGDMMHRKDFVSAAKYLDNMLKVNPTDGEAFFLRFLAGLSCADGEEFIDYRSPGNLDFTDFERAIAYTQDPARRKYFYDVLFKNVQASHMLPCYREYIELPESGEKEIAALTEVMYRCALDRVDAEMFDEVLRAVTDTEKYIAMNLEFAEIAEAKMGAQNVLKYYKNVLGIDEGNLAARWHCFWIESGASAGALLDRFARGGAAEFEEALFSYGYNGYANGKLFDACVMYVSSRTEEACCLFDFVLTMIPTSSNAAYLEYIRQFIDALFLADRVNFAVRYNELLLGADRLDDGAYFNRVLIKHGLHNPLALLELAGTLLEDEDYFSAINSFAERHPKQKNLYLDINDAMNELSGIIVDEECRKYAYGVLFLKKEELPGCKDEVLKCLEDEGKRAFLALCKDRGCSDPEQLFELKEDITSDPLLLRADLFARNSQRKLGEMTAHILRKQAAAAAKNIVEERKATVLRRIYWGIGAFAAIVALATFITCIISFSGGALGNYYDRLYNFDDGGVGAFCLLMVFSLAVLIGYGAMLFFKEGRPDPKAMRVLGAFWCLYTVAVMILHIIGICKFF